MNSLKKLRVKRITMICASVAIVTGVFGQACSDGSFMNGGDSGGSSSSSGSISPSGDVTIIPGARTAAVVYGKEAFDTMANCLGVASPSAQTVSEWQNRMPSISEDGYATTVNAPMMMSLASIAGYMCLDLINQESTAGADKFVFTEVDFTKGLSQVPSSAYPSIIRRLARKCWQRNETSEERVLIETAISELTASVDQNSTVQTKNTMIGICTGVVASLSGIAK